MLGIPITNLTLEPAGLRRLASGSKDSRAARRLLAIALLLEGKSRTEAATATGMDRQTLRDWVHRYNQSGPDGLISRRPTGRPPLLTAGQEAQLADWVRAGPDPVRDGVVRWRRRDLVARIAREFDVVLAERTVGALLKQLGFVRLSVRPRHPAQDGQALETHKKTLPVWSPRA